MRDFVGKSSDRRARAADGLHLAHCGTRSKTYATELTIV
jgi:hypothetical protein